MIEKRMFSMRTRREIGEAVNGAPCICHLFAPPPSTRGVPFFPQWRSTSLQLSPLFGCEERERERERFNAQAARTIARYIYTPSPHLRTHTHKHVYRYDLESAARDRPSIFPSIARFIVFWQRRWALVSRNHLRSAFTVSRSRSHRREIDLIDARVCPANSRTPYSSSPSVVVARRHPLGFLGFLLVALDDGIWSDQI